MFFSYSVIGRFAILPKDYRQTNPRPEQAIAYSKNTNSGLGRKGTRSKRRIIKTAFPDHYIMHYYAIESTTGIKQ